MITQSRTVLPQESISLYSYDGFRFAEHEESDSIERFNQFNCQPRHPLEPDLPSMTFYQTLVVSQTLAFYHILFLSQSQIFYHIQIIKKTLISINNPIVFTDVLIFQRSKGERMKRAINFHLSAKCLVGGHSRIISSLQLNKISHCRSNSEFFRSFRKIKKEK